MQVSFSKQRVLDLLSNSLSSLIDLILLAIGIYLIWWFYMGRSFSDLYSGNDTFAILADLKTMENLGYSSNQYLYDPKRMGGLPVITAIGLVPLYQLATIIFDNIVYASNFIMITVQALIGFIGKNFYHKINRENIVSRRILLVVALIISFSPVFGWRISYGHFLVLIGSLTLVSTLNIFLSFYYKKIDLIEIICTFFIYICSLQSLGAYQTTYYSVLLILFFFPLALKYYRLDKSAFKNASLYTLFLILASFVYSLDILYLIFSTMDEMARVDQKNIIYSYLTQSYKDWISSISGDPYLINFRKDSFHKHETHYPFGMILPFLYLWLRRKPCKILSVCLAFALTFSIILADNIVPFSSLIIGIVPLVDKFRVPARIVIPLFMVLLPICLAAIPLNKSHLKYKWHTYVFYFLIFVSILILPIFVVEIVFVVLFLLMITFKDKKFSLSNTYCQHFIMFFSLMLSIICFDEIKHTRSIQEEGLPKKLNSEIINLVRNSPLKRVALKRHPFPSLYLSASLFYDLNTIDAWTVPAGNIFKLYEAMNPKYNPSGHGLIIGKNFNSLYDLFNISLIIRDNGNSNVEVEVRENINKPEIWSSEKLVMFKGINEIADYINSPGFTREKITPIEDYDGAMDINEIGKCDVINFDYLKLPKLLTVSIESKQPCHVNIPFNYSSFLMGTINGKEVVPLKSFGSITTFLFNSGNSNLELYAKKTTNQLIKLLQYITLAGCIFLLIFRLHNLLRGLDNNNASKANH